LGWNNAILGKARFDISNAVRELSKVADGVTMAHWKLLLCNIKHVITTKYIALKLKPNANKYHFFMEGTPTEDKGLTLGGTRDSKFGTDPDWRISVFGYYIYFCEALIAWKSKDGKSVTLSSTEAEYVALSAITKEVMFVKQVLETMGIKLNLPILVKVDNVGAIYLSNNHSLSQQTKHIDIRRLCTRLLKTNFNKTLRNLTIRIKWYETVLGIYRNMHLHQLKHSAEACGKISKRKYKYKKKEIGIVPIHQVILKMMMYGKTDQLK
jgi:hypothetical protein